MEFSERLLNLIKEKGITNKKMLDDLNINKNAIVSWVKRDNTPHGETLRKIAEYFNVSTDYLLGKTDIKKSVTRDDDGFSELDMKIISDFQKLTPEGQKQVLAFLDFVKHQP